MRRSVISILLLSGASSLALPSCQDTSLAPTVVEARTDGDAAQSPRRADEHPADYRRELWEWRRQALLSEDGTIDMKALAETRAKIQAMQTGPAAPNATGFNATDWRAGPANLAGRMRTLNIDPRDPDIMIAGAASGGIWRSTDGGGSWVAVGDMLPSMSISDIVRSTVTPDTLVASTGELFLENGFGGIPFGGAGEAIQGAGIYRSTDNGLTWSVVSPVPNEAFHLDISPSGDIILAATEAGILRSVDLGSTWTTVTTVPVSDVAFHKTDPNRVIATASFITRSLQVSIRIIPPPPPPQLPCRTVTRQLRESRSLRSTNGGLNWSVSIIDTFPLQTFTNCSGNIFVQRTPATRYEVVYHNNSTIYAVSDLGAVHRSVDDGATWSRVGSASIGPQGWYDLAIWVDRSDVDNNPANDLVVVGGVTLLRSVNGGGNFSQISNDLVPGSAHDDHHFILEDPGLLTNQNRTVYTVSDGGIFRTDNIDTVVTTGPWVPRNNGMATTQFYGASTHRTTRRTVGGTQDQGGLRTENFAPFSEIVDTAGGFTLGDAGFSAVDQEDPNFCYVTGTNLEVFRSTDGGLNVTQVGPSTTDPSNFFAPMILHPDNRDRLFIGGTSLFESTNPRAGTPTWTVIKPSVSNNPIAAVAAMETATEDVIWVAHNGRFGSTNSRIYFTTNGGTNWTQDSFPQRPARLPMRVTIDPADPMHVFVCFGGFAADNVWERSPTGVWTAVNLPVSAPVRDFELDRADPNCFILATQVGLFVSPDRGVNWQLVSPANVSVEETYWSRGHLFLATHGRGLFSQTPYATASEQKVGIACTLNGTPVTGPEFTTGTPELGLDVPMKAVQGTPNAAIFILFGDPPPAPVPACGAQGINMVTLFSGALDATGRADFSLPLPDDPAFAGVDFILQAVEVNGNTITLYNGVRWTVGY